MAGRSRLLTAAAVGRLLNYIRMKSAEPAERALCAEMIRGIEGVQAVASFERERALFTWVGSTAATLGLTGQAESKEAAMVFKDGRSPVTKELIRTKIPAPRGATGKPLERRAAYGRMFSAPKTVSLLLASENAAVRRAAKEALECAADQALRELERLVAVRRGAGGKTSEGVRGLLGVRVTHYTSSAGDPHLHAYYILSSSAPAASDGQWRALDTRVLLASQRIAEAAFNDTLHRELSIRLGLRSEDWELGMICNVPMYNLKALIPAVERFSRARACMAEIIADPDRRFRVPLTYKQDALIWMLHRQDCALAEEIEHRIDAAIAHGDDVAKAIRAEWRSRLGELRPSLDAFDVQPHQTEPPIKSDGPLASLRSETITSIDFAKDLRCMVREMVQGHRLRPFAAADVVARFRGFGLALDEARRAAAATLRFWYSEGLIKLPRNFEIDVFAHAVEVGHVQDAKLQHAATGYTGKIVPVGLPLSP